jgi:hypothetical protein
MTDETLNIFQMFVANGYETGFWVKRTPWGNSCARVTEVEPFTGPPPYFGNPKVFAEIYDPATGELKDARMRVPVPGTYKTWRQIPTPNWSANLADVPKEVRRSPASINSTAMPRAYFRVPYEHRQDIKALGGRWDASRKLWWLPADQGRLIEAAQTAGFAEVTG